MAQDSWLVKLTRPLGEGNIAEFKRRGLVMWSVRVGESWSLMRFASPVRASKVKELLPETECVVSPAVIRTIPDIPRVVDAPDERAVSIAEDWVSVGGHTGVLEILKRCTRTCVVSRDPVMYDGLASVVVQHEEEAPEDHLVIVVREDEALVRVPVETILAAIPTRFLKTPS